jgi:hypothetical protein
MKMLIEEAGGQTKGQESKANGWWMEWALEKAFCSWHFISVTLHFLFLT